MKSNALVAREVPAGCAARSAALLLLAASSAALVLLAARSAAAAPAPAPAEPTQGELLRGMAALSLGRGLRFNNPYRLETPLGDTAESVSLSATYLDLSLAMLLQGSSVDQGLSLSALFALDGIGQFGLTPSYLAQLPVSRRFAARGRLGLPIVVAPDATVGVEAALGSNFLIGHGLGLTSELVASVFFGAATEEQSVTTIPMLSLQLGVMFEHGVM